MNNTSKVKEAAEAAANNATERQEPVARVRITYPNLKTLAFRLLGGEEVGGAPLSVCRFSKKAAEAMEAAQRAGSTARSKKKRDPKNFEELFQEALYVHKDGWYGLHAAAIRNASISACRLVDYKMTLAKLAIRVIADGRDEKDGTPLLHIWSDAPPKMWIAPVRNANGSFDLRPRPRWDKWEIRPRIQYDADQFTAEDVTNLVARIGLQVGVGEGRPDSKNSPGLDMGLFVISSEEYKAA